MANPFLLSAPKFALQFGFRPMGARLLYFRRSIGAVSVRGRSVSKSAPRRLLPWFGFYLMVSPPSRSLQQKLSRRTVTAAPPDETQSLVIPQPKSWPSPYHITRRSCSKSFAEAPDYPVGGGTYKLRRVCISLIASLALSPGFVTNTLLGLSRPVGKGPGRLPKKSSTTP